MGEFISLSPGQDAPGIAPAEALPRLRDIAPLDDFLSDWNK
jgi:hypothetical protein